MGGDVIGIICATEVGPVSIQFSTMSGPTSKWTAPVYLPRQIRLTASSNNVLIVIEGSSSLCQKKPSKITQIGYVSIYCSITGGDMAKWKAPVDLMRGIGEITLPNDVLIVVGDTSSVN
jgi:hypothetical protein